MEIKKQQDLQDCGLNVIQSLIYYHHNKSVTINELKNKVDYGKDGISIANLVDLADLFGLICNAYEVDSETLFASQNKDPYIALIKVNNQNHYVIVEKINNKVIYLDPMVGKVKVSLEEFSKIYLNVIITVAKGLYSYKQFTLKSFSLYVQQSKFIYPWVLITIICSITISFASSWFIKLVLDSVLPNHMTKLLFILLISFLWLAILKILNTLFKNYLVNKIHLSISLKIYNKFFYKMQRGELEVINKLSTSDKMRRMTMIENISTYLSHVFFALFSESLFLILSIGILSWINIKLFIIVSIAGILVIAITGIHQYLISNKYKKVIKSHLDFSTINLDMLLLKNQIKNKDLAELISLKQISKLEKFKSQELQIWKINASQNTFTSLILTITPVILIYLSTKQIINGEMSVGSMLLFLALFQQFLSPLTTFTNIVIQYPLIKQEIEMINYVLNAKEEDLNTGGIEIKEIKSIEFNNYSFGYERNKSLLLIDKLKIESNVKLTGKNGTGKSSILNILSSRYQGLGELKINGININKINLETYRSSIFFASENDYLPSMKIIEYVTDAKTSKWETLEANVIKYGINNFLEDLRLDLNYAIEGNGDNLSSGQRQAIQILKLFSQKYQLILLDEAFENIDVKNQKWLVASIMDFQKDAIFVEVSHNKKVIVDAKEVSIEKFSKN